MALTVESENTSTPVLNTPLTLFAPTTSAVRVMRLDLTSLTGTDVVNLRVQSKVRATGTLRDQFNLNYISTVGSKVVELPPIAATRGATFILTQTAGLARSFSWKVLSLFTAAVETEDTLTAAINTPATIAAATTNKTRLLRVDLGNMVNGDALDIIVQSKVRSTDSIVTQYHQGYIHAQGLPIVESVAVAGDLGATFILNQTAGAAGRQFPWEIVTLD